MPAVLLKPPSGNPPRLISQRDVPITEADREGFYHKRIKLETPGVGLYLMDVSHAGNTVCAWAMVTDTALITKRARDQFLAYVVDMKTGQPQGGNPIQILRGGRKIAAGRTDAGGLARFTIARPSGGSEDGFGSNSGLTAVALRGDDEAIMGRDYYSYEEEGAFTVHAYTERPIYRPGQRVYYKGIARRVLDPGMRYTVPKKEAVAVEIRDPEGERILKEQRSTNGFGSFSGSVELSPEAPTGVYTMVTSVGGEEHTHDIVVASYRKPEFSVEVTPAKPRYRRGETVEMTVSAQFYFGVPLAGAKVKYSVSREADWSGRYAGEDTEDDSAFYAEEAEGEGYEGEGEGGGYGETVKEGELRLDENGKATIRVSSRPDDKADDSSREVQAEVFSTNVTVTDDAEREVSGDGKARVTAGDFRLAVRPEGYVAEPAKPANIFVTATDYDGKPVANVPVELEIGFDRWNANYTESTYKLVGEKRATTGPNGRATFAMTPPKSGSLRLKARAWDRAGGSIQDNAYLWVAGDEGGDFGTRYADLSLHTDKRRYKSGETARVLINADRLGQTALLTVEGTKIHRTIAVPLKQRSTIVRLPVLAEYGPNVFLAACYVRDKHFAQSQISLRVSVPEREVTVKVQADRKEYEPGDKVQYQVRTLDNKGQPVPCEVSFGVVDESIYALREDQPRALRDAFYPRRYNGVNTAYSFAVQYLGDAAKAEPQITARKKFPDTAYWQPALQTDDDGKATISVTLPDNLTTWRATAVAQTATTAFGRETNKIIVAKEFFVRLEKPRFLTQRDQSRLFALVHNETGKKQTAYVKLVAEGLTSEAETTQTLSVEPGQVGQAVWPVTAEKLGDAKLRVTAWTPKGEGAQYTDGLEVSLPVRAHGREEITGLAGELTASRPATEVVTLKPEAIGDAGRLTVRITPSIVNSLVGALKYLIGYPYGCTEQTMSRFLPDILVQRVLRLSGTRDAKMEAELPRMVRDSLTRLYRMQHESGGWGWWEHDTDDAWMTAYVLYGLATAQSEGYTVSPDVLARARKAAVNLLSKIAKGDDETRAYLLYALALSGDQNTARAGRAKLRIRGMSSVSLSYAVLLDQLLGTSGPTALAEMESRAVTEDRMTHWKYGTPVYWCDSDWNDRSATAAGLRAMLAVNKNDPRVPSVLRWLMAQRTGDYWGNTRDTSFVLAALCDYLRSHPEAAAPRGEVRVRLNGESLHTYALTPDLDLNQPVDTSRRYERRPVSGDLVLRVPQSSLRGGKNELTLERVGGTSPVFYSIEMRQTVASEDMPAVSPSNIGVTREYLRLKPRKAGSDRWSLQTEPTNNQLDQGDRIRVKLTINVPRDMSYVLIEDAFPSGCEVTERGTADEVVDWGYWWSSVDVRDDRIAFFARRLSKGKHELTYNLRAQTPGTYHTLPTLVQAMYAPETRGESAEARVEVR